MISLTCTYITSNEIKSSTKTQTKNHHYITTSLFIVITIAVWFYKSQKMHHETSILLFTTLTLTIYQNIQSYPFRYNHRQALTLTLVLPLSL